MEQLVYSQTVVSVS